MNDTFNPFAALLDLYRDGKSWCQFSMHEGSDYQPPQRRRHCLLGGLELLERNSWTQSHSAKSPTALSILFRVIKEQYPERMKMSPNIVVSFNDDPRTNWEDVRIVLEKSAVIWHERMDD